MKLFTPGPVQVSPDILKIAEQPMPYPRGDAFSKILRECVEGLKSIFQTKHEVAILSSEGTAGMEAALVNFIKPHQRALFIDTGAFSSRWAAIAEVYGVDADLFYVERGRAVDLQTLEKQLSTTHYDAVLVVANETSTGQLYDVEAIGKLAKKHDALFVVDAISSVVADEFRMDDWCVDVALLSPEKALALPPGLTFVAVSDFAMKRIGAHPSFYLNLKHYFDWQAKGQSPFTPAIIQVMMLHVRLSQLKLSLDQEIEKHHQRAMYFRQQLGALGLKIFPENPSNALTVVECPEKIDAEKLVQHLASKDIFIGTTSADLKDKLFRVSHMGEQTRKAVDDLLCEIKSYCRLPPSSGLAGGSKF